jgi:PQQ-dependent catabolism-associated CXXCW motif protein
MTLGRTPLKPALVILSAVLFAGNASAQSRTDMAREQRVALVIGNSSYVVSPLKNPVNDAEDIAQTLGTLGFRVTLRKNATHRQMIEAISAFGQDLKKGGVGLFYFAGHGVQSKGRNFLIPVNANIDGEAQLEFDTVDANRVLAAMDEAGNRVNLVILDACRNNPFARSFRSATRGLAQMEAAQGSYIAFATGPGSVALDGDGRNGLYTQHLLRSLKQSDTDVDKVFRRVTADVSRATGGKQVPWVSSSLTGDFSFKLDRPVAAAPKVDSTAAPKVDSAVNDRVFWESVKDSRNPDELNAYLEKFPDGTFAGLARARLKSLAAAKPPTQVATATPGTPAPTPAREVAQGDARAKFSIAALPFLSDGARARIEREFAASKPEEAHALALTEAGGWGLSSRATIEAAQARALENCQRQNPRHPCILAAVNDQIVLKSTYTTQAMHDGAMELLRRAALDTEFYFNEERDDGIAPPSSRHTGQMHAPTPRSAPGAKTITTRQLVELYKSAKPMLINVLDWTEGAFALPGTVWIQGMGKASLSKAQLAELQTLLAQVAPDKNAPLVVYCLSSECWLSYNAALTASELGYKNLYWYRGGVSAWNQAKLPVVRTKLLKQF